MTAATLYPRLARLALACIDRRYPYAPHHVHTAPADTGARLHPAFGGCFDWHSAVHAHWCLARVMRLLPRAETNSRSAAVLSRHLAPSAVAAKVAYLRRPEAHYFEAPYGWAWLLALAAELARLTVAPAARWRAALAPLAALVTPRAVTYFRRLPAPIGCESQSDDSGGTTVSTQRRPRPLRRRVRWPQAATTLPRSDHSEPSRVTSGSLGLPPLASASASASVARSSGARRACLLLAARRRFLVMGKPARVAATRFVRPGCRTP